MNQPIGGSRQQPEPVLHQEGIVAFALGGESGNGYNMYKAYEWLKSVEKSRPVICADADGEWNSDL